MPVFVLDEEIIFRSWDGDILKVNTHSNKTELLMKNTTFVSVSYRLLKIWDKFFWGIELISLIVVPKAVKSQNEHASITKMLK